MFTIYNEDFDIEKIALSGQCFRMNHLNDGRWQLIAGSKLSYAIQAGSECIISCPDKDDDFWKNYFDLSTDYKKIRESVDPNDSFLSAAVDFGCGIRILRQDPWEMLITYLISQRRSIPSIKTCVERISKRWGTEIIKNIYAFPTPNQLAEAKIEELLDCGLGYRAEYVYLAAQKASSGEIDFDSLSTLSDEELLEHLLSLRGVGPKVANCVSLFGFYRIAAFPIDVWIDRVQKTYYGGAFPVERYKKYAGIIQQYIFYFARLGK